MLVASIETEIIVDALTGLSAERRFRAAFQRIISESERRYWRSVHKQVLQCLQLDMTIKNRNEPVSIARHSLWKYGAWWLSWMQPVAKVVLNDINLQLMYADLQGVHESSVVGGI